MFGGFMWIFWIFIIIGLVFLFKWILPQGRSDGVRSSESALDILKRKYASGEIDKEEFERKKENKNLLFS